jgi:hypothetical protein
MMNAGGWSAVQTQSCSPKTTAPLQEGGCRGMDGKEIRVQAHRVLGEVRCEFIRGSLTEIQNDLEPFSSRPLHIVEWLGHST